MESMNIFGLKIPLFVYVPAVYLIWVTALLFLKAFIFRAFRKAADKTKTKADDIFLNALDFPLVLLVFASGWLFLEKTTPFLGNIEMAKFVVLGFKAIVIVSVVLFIDKLISSLLLSYSNKVDILKTSGGVARSIARVLVIGIGFLILLDSFGVSITPIIASLGIGSLAVALALQPTLENFFSGIQLVVDKPIKVGHFVKLESGEEGYVHRIGWRSTWIRMLPNNMVVIPNKSLVSSRVTNYYYPEKEMAVLVQVGVHYESDLEHVEKVTIEVGKETMKEVTGGVPEFEPFTRYHTFDDFSINFTVILRAKEFVDNYLIKHEFIKRLHNRYAKEGINIPYPIRAINYDQEKAFEKKK
ncbi:MAG: mechanosensitive ion channel family protein [Candidatus Aceula meridiana]|nr:mechanosensitive ion channel family protein [Candidatus Aceula meridiana]